MPEASSIRPEVIHPTPESSGIEVGETLSVGRSERGAETPSEITAPVQPIPAPVTDPAPLAPAAAPLPQHVEEILSAGLAETYNQLDPATQQQFRVVGEQTANKISVLLQDSRVQVKKIVDLIINWLRIIPGVNQFFLEQEAKIKADKILTLRPPQP